MSDKLTANELEQYNIDKRKMFQTTIAIAAIYGAIAFVLLLVMLTDSNDVSGLATEYLPFTATLISGMVVALIILVTKITTFQPVSKKAPVSGIDTICPDYWVLQQTSPSATDFKNADTGTQAYMKYQCVPDKNIYDPLSKWDAALQTYTRVTAKDDTNVLGQKVLSYTSPTDNTIGLYLGPKSENGSVNPRHPTSKLVDVAGKVYSSSQTGVSAGSSNLRCDMVYPQYMAFRDSQDFPDNPTSLRCEYSKQCNIPWTGVCPMIT
jgi:hypothetical protein